TVASKVKVSWGDRVRPLGVGAAQRPSRVLRSPPPPRGDATVPSIRHPANRSAPGRLPCHKLKCQSSAPLNCSGQKWAVRRKLTLPSLRPPSRFHPAHRPLPRPPPMDLNPSQERQLPCL